MFTVLLHQACVLLAKYGSAMGEPALMHAGRCIDDFYMSQKALHKLAGTG